MYEVGYQLSIETYLFRVVIKSFHPIFLFSKTYILSDF